MKRVTSEFHCTIETLHCDSSGHPDGIEPSGLSFDPTRPFPIEHRLLEYIHIGSTVPLSRSMETATPKAGALPGVSDEILDPATDADLETGEGSGQSSALPAGGDAKATPGEAKALPLPAPKAKTISGSPT